MTDLNKLLDEVQVPNNREALKSRILQNAKTMRAPDIITKPANDNKWAWVSGIAACLIAVSVIGLSFQTSDTINPEDDAELWAEAAESIGYDDLYEWVNAPVSEAQ